MAMKRWIGPAALLLGVLGPLAAQAADDAKGDARELSNYTRTGKTETCLQNHLIRASHILNRHQILFELSDRKVYVGEVEQCPSLSPGYTLAYDATIDQLCTTSIIHILDTNSPVPDHGACGVSRFEELQKKPKAN